MRTITKALYSARELQEQFPEAFDRAFQKYTEGTDEVFCQDETVESLKATIKATGYILKDWSLGMERSRSYIKIDHRDCDDLKGPRALRWLENQVLGPLRIPWTGKRRKELAQYGEYYRPGMVKPCPFTGYCADDDFLDDLRKSIKSGDTVRDAVRGLADKYSGLIEDEYNRQLSLEYFLDHAEANKWEYDEEGNRQ